MTSPIFVGCAGWQLPKGVQSEFPEEGSHLARYSSRLNLVEINSSFYRPHRRATYERWASTVPADFRFAVKVPKSITHTAKLHAVAKPFDEFLEQAMGLGDALAVLLIQIPPSFAFDAKRAKTFFERARSRFSGDLVFEPRHPSWFTPEAEDILVEHAVARVAADPARVPSASRPGGTKTCVYFRLHGSPRIYFSPYDSNFLHQIGNQLQAAQRQRARVYCIFDNTGLGAATANALELRAFLGHAP